MAIEGNTRSFGVDELLQTVAMNKGGGKLWIVCNDRGEAQGWERNLYFSQGNLTFVTNSQGPVVKLSHLLPRSGVISKEEWEEVFGNQSPTSEMIIQEFGIDPTVIRGLVDKAYENELLEVLSWTNADFVFQPDAELEQEYPQVDPLLLSALPIERTVMEVLRQLDELEVWKREFPSLDDYYCVTEAPGQVVRELQVNPTERRVLHLLDGHHSLRNILEEIFISTYTLYSLLALLKEKGWLRKMGAKELRKAADYWLELGDTERAAQCLRRCVSLESDDKIWQELIELYEDKGDYGTMASLYLEWGELLWKQGRKRFAIEKFRQALRFRPSSEEIQKNLMEAYLSLGEYEEAERVALGLVRDLKRTQNYREGIRILRPFWETGKASLQARLELAELFSAINNPTQAVQLYEEVAREYDFQGKKNSLKKVCQAILALDPNHSWAQEVTGVKKEVSKKIEIAKHQKGVSLLLFAGMAVLGLTVAFFLWKWFFGGS